LAEEAGNGREWCKDMKKVKTLASAAILMIAIIAWLRRREGKK